VADLLVHFGPGPNDDITETSVALVVHLSIIKFSDSVYGSDSPDTVPDRTVQINFLIIECAFKLVIIMDDGERLHTSTSSFVFVRGEVGNYSIEVGLDIGSWI
jgi:hypothetical protein